MDLNIYIYISSASLALGVGSTSSPHVPPSSLPPATCITFLHSVSTVSEERRPRATNRQS